MPKLFKILVVLLASKAGMALLGKLSNSPCLPRPVRWGALAGLLLLTLRK